MKNIAEWAKDETLRAKAEAVFARAEADAPRRKLRRRLMTWEWLRPRPLSRLKLLGYVGSTISRFGIRPLNKLGLRRHPTYGRWIMYTTLLLSGKLPPPASRLRMLLRRLSLLDLKLLWL